MKIENNNNKMPSPEDFWPDAKVLLDHHFAKRKKMFFFFGMSLVLIISTIGLFFISIHNNDKKTSLNKPKSEASLIHPKYTAIKKDVKTSKVEIYENEVNAPAAISEGQIDQKNSYKKGIIHINENLRGTTNSKVENYNILSNKKKEFIVLNSQNKVEILIDNKVISREKTDPIVFSKIALRSFKMVEHTLDFNLYGYKYPAVDSDDEYFKNKKKLNYFIVAFTGVQSVNKLIKTDQTLTEYADIRNTSEEKINKLYFGINFMVEKKNFLLQTGIEYNNIGEHNNYEAKSKQWLQNDEKVWDVYNKQIIKVDTVYHFGIVNYNQTIVNVRDSTLLTKSDSVFIYNSDSNIVKANGKTTINYLEIPFMIGYQFRFGKASIAPFAGISVGYLTKTYGMYINKTITGIEEISDARLINNFNFNYQIKLQLAYNITDNIMLVLTPQYRNNMVSVSPKSSGISTKYSALGTSFGLSYKL